MYADDLVLCGESKDELRAMVGRFIGVCRKRGLKIKAGKTKVKVLNGEEGLECEADVDGIRLEHASEFKYWRYVLDESGTDGAECSKKVASGRRVADAIKFLVNAKDLQIECVRVLHETLLVPVLMYDSETMLWKAKERSRITVVQMDNLKGLLGIRRTDKSPE